MLSLEMQEKLIRVAMEEAELALERGDDPFGSVIADQAGNIIVRDGNCQNSEQDPTAHAEIVAIRKAARKLGTNDLSGYISVCNAESCPMCATALILAGVREFYFGTFAEGFSKPYIRMRDVLDKTYDDSIIIVDGILYEECRDLVAKGRLLRRSDVPKK